MDKNKKKSDLLAAGRKKLQQFRQKKDNKGSKSSKSGKTERNADTSSPKRATVSQSSKMEGDADTSSPKRATVSQSGKMEGDANTSSPKQATLSQSGKMKGDTDTNSPKRATVSQSGEMEGDANTSSPKHATVSQSGKMEGDADTSSPERATVSQSGKMEGDADTSYPKQATVSQSDKTEGDTDTSSPKQATVSQSGEMQDDADTSSPKRAKVSQSGEMEGDPDTCSSKLATISQSGNMERNDNTSSPKQAIASQSGETERNNVTNSPKGATTSQSGKVNYNDDTSSPKRATTPQTGRKGNWKRSSHGADDTVTSSKSHSQGKVSADRDKAVATVVDQPPEAASARSTAENTTEFSVEEPTQDHQNAEGLGLMQVDETVERVIREDGKPSTSESDAPLDVSFGTMSDQSEALMSKPSIDYPEDTEEIQAETVGEAVDIQGASVSKSYIKEEVLQSEINNSPARQDVVEMVPLLEKIKEQLYLTTLVKDEAHLKLSEQMNIQSELSQQTLQFPDKLSSATTSLDEIYANNENLREEVARYEYQLKEAVSIKEGLQEELNESKDEVEKSSARVNQLTNELDISRDDLSRLSSELVECRNSLVAFQTENETLRLSLHLETEEKEQLVVHKTNMILENEKLESELTKYNDLIVSLRSEKHIAQAGGTNGKISSENELLLSQNHKLVSELGECKDMLLSLQLENENLNTTVLEEKKKIDQEKDYLWNESEKIVMESIKCMVLVKAMQMEIFSNKSTDERSILEEEKMYLFTENEKLSCELVNYKAIIENLQAKITKAESLKEHSDCIGEVNLELMILLEALRQHVVESNMKGSELVSLYEASQERAENLRAEESTITLKICDFEDKISELQSHLNETYQRSGETFSSLSSQVEALDKVVVSREILLEEEWNSVVMQIIQMLDKLNSSSTMINSNSISSSSDIISCVAASVDAATNIIEDLKGQLKASKQDHELVLSTYNEVNDKSTGLQEQQKMAFTMLHKVYSDLVRLVKGSCSSIEENDCNTIEERLLDPRAPGGFDALINQVEAFLSEKLMLEYENNRLSSELADRTNDIDEITKNSVGSDAILKLLEKVGQDFRIEGFGSENLQPLPQLEFLIYSLVQKYKEGDERANFSREMHACNPGELSDNGQIDYLSLSLIQHENEVIVLKESLKNFKVSFVAIKSELLGKIDELKQSEQRVSSLREKLSIAVTKGKGLIVQRDNLKQSLADTSSDFEKCKQKSLAQESMLSELQNKLKSYMEAGERMEALESELSYIRDSATALRESFILKDSALQRIEEILEDLQLPEYLDAADIIEKIDWLAKYVSGNSLPFADSNQKISVAGGTYSDAKLVDAGGSKEEMQPDASDDYRKIYEDMQTRFFGLAQQNEVLEQSLMERNNLVQRWEEILDKIQVPSQLRSMKPEDRIEWLGGTLSEAENYCNSLQEKIDHLETFSASITTDLERSEQRTSELEKVLQSVTTEKEALLQNLEILTQDHDGMSKKASGLQREVVLLQERLDQKDDCDERAQYFEGEIRRLQDVLMGVLQDSGLEDPTNRSDGFSYFENLLMKLLEKHAELSRSVLDKQDAKPLIEGPKDPVEQFKVLEHSKAEIIILNKKLDDTISELLSVKEERNGFLEKKDSLVLEVEALGIKMINLQDQLSQEEHKSSTLREKLNVAVRKGKSLVQQRDSMKQVIEERNSEIGQLQSVISEYENKTENFSTLQEKLETLSSENIHLRDLISQSAVQGNDHTLSKILEALGHIDVGLETDISDPVEKLEKLGTHCKDLLSDLATAEQESSNSKRASEILVAELNEVQERNDVLQEELAKVSTDLSAISRERDRYDAGTMQMGSNMDQLNKDLSSLNELLGNVLSNDLETLHDLKACIKSCHGLGDAPSLLAQLPGSIPGELISFKSEDKALAQGIGSLRGQLYRHMELVHEERSGLADLIGLVYSELNSRKESCESMKRDIQRLESVEIEKDSKLLSARRNFSLLLDACARTVTDIDNFIKELVGRGLESGDTSKFTEETLLFSSEEGIRGIQEQLSFAVKDLMSMQAEKSDINLKDMRSTVHSLQKELQEKDIQGERNCMQLVQQIKEAEAIAKKYSQELQLSQGNVEELQREVRLMEEERNVMEKRTKDLQDIEAACMEDNGKIQSLTDELATKGQENEALLQGLDEEEIQMDDMRNKIGELERALQQKEQDLEKLNISRGKALKKLSVTVRKFDEVHLFTENLLSEVENLQSQLQDRDQDISFLRQEVTRCTKDALLASQISNKRTSDEVSELLAWLATMFPRVQAVESNISDMQADEYKEMLKEQIISAASELDDLRVAVQNGNMLLQSEKEKVEELTSKEQSLRSYLREKESQLAMLHGDVGQSTTPSPGIVEFEPMMKKKAVSAGVAPQVRSLRKANSEQLAIAIDVHPDNEKLEEDDDDKAHGFRSLTTSRIVPRFTRPITNLVDGLWVSCDRTLMRQPILRLGVMIYWALVHALLTAYAF